MADRDRIASRLQALWEIASGPAGGADRPAFSPAEAEAMLLIAQWADEADLHPGVDRHGNLWALPSDWDGPLLTSGSHVDTVPDGGRYDGALGSVLALEFVDDLKAGGAARGGLLVFAAEEAPRFGAGTIGSRLLTGAMSSDDLHQLTDRDGVTAAAAQADHLGRLRDHLPRIEAPLHRVAAHAEVHVAQRRSLRRLGVVTRVASPRRFELTLTGESGHAGEVAMTDRRDALVAGAEIILAIDAAARAEPAETVATTGAIAVSPGAVSVIPGRTLLGVDVRGTDGRSLDRVETALRSATAEVSERRGVVAEVRQTRAGEPVALDPVLADAALACAERRGIPAEPTWSGAGHDSQHLAARIPTLLLFVPLHGGESHTPDEGADLGEIVQAADVVAATLGTRVSEVPAG
ncbi:MAG TPA: Zn-dependent hydrolase [Solirubrobacteraceae bacterium]|nr:Zn-dependent hydrolase [Solirubrobacteraceae bacterium]